MSIFTEDKPIIFSNLCLHFDDDDLESFKKDYDIFVNEYGMTDTHLFDLVLGTQSAIKCFSFLVDEIESWKGTRVITPYNIHYMDSFNTDGNDKYGIYTTIRDMSIQFGHFGETIAVNCDVEFIKKINSSIGFKAVLLTYFRKKGNFGLYRVHPTAKVHSASNEFITELFKFLGINDVDIVLHISQMNPNTWMYHLLNRYIKHGDIEKNT